MKATRMTLVCVVLIGFPTESMNVKTQEAYSAPLFKTESQSEPQSEPQTRFKTEPQTIEEQILAVLIDSGFSTCEQAIILAQSKHESGHYTNSISRKNNNVFSLHKRRNSIYVLPEKARAEGCTCFATYRNIQDATLDYMQYRAGLSIPIDLSVEEYVAFIKRKKYFTDNEECYLSSMQSLIKKDDSLVANFNARYPGCPTDIYPSAEIPSVRSRFFSPLPVIPDLGKFRNESIQDFLKDI